MAISGFGAQNNLKLTKPLNLNQVNQQVQAQEEETKNVEIKQVDLQAPKTSLGQLKYGQVESLLAGKGIKINRPEEPAVKLNAHYGSLDDWISAYNNGLIKEGEIHTFTTLDGKEAKIMYREDTVWMTFEGKVHLQTELSAIVN